MYKPVALRLGLMSTRPTGALALMSQQHEVVHVVLNKLLSSGVIRYQPKIVKIILCDEYQIGVKLYH